MTACQSALPLATLLLGLLLSSCSSEPSRLPIHDTTAETTAGSDQGIEASGIIPHPSRNGRYLVISDESPSGKTTLYEIDQTGEVTHHYPVDRKVNLDDLESISSSSMGILLCASLSATKKGELKKPRQRCALVATPTTGSSNTPLQKLAEINLYKILKHAARSSSDGDLHAFLSKAIKDKTLDVEAHTLWKDQWLLGIKSPHWHDETVILSLGSLPSVLQGKARPRIWTTIRLHNGERNTRLSDMAVLDDQHLLLTTSRKNQSELWIYAIDEEKLTLVSRFDNARAEGVSHDASLKAALVVFDGGGKTESTLSIIPLPYP